MLKRDPEIPKTNWYCVGLSVAARIATDPRTGTCEWCHTSIKYQHHMRHADWPNEVIMGCVCAGRLSDPAEAERREKTFKQALNARLNWIAVGPSKVKAQYQGYRITLTRFEAGWKPFIICGNDVVLRGSKPVQDVDQLKRAVQRWLAKALALADEPSRPDSAHRPILQQSRTPGKEAFLAHICGYWPDR